jgi:mannosyl-oligosaccharide alpha-1,3-glucosidase
VITDPHIKVDPNYTVFSEGMLYDMKVFDNSMVMSTFVKNKTLKQFQGDCWPGKSQWVDFFNKLGRQWWSSQYRYDKFIGSKGLVSGIWIDMNEPSVFNQPETTMPREKALHVSEDGRFILHRDVHNAFGLMMAKATYEGLLERDQN